MYEQIVAIYTLVKDLLLGLGHQENSQCRMNDSEVNTTALVAALFFDGRSSQFMVPNIIAFVGAGDTVFAVTTSPFYTSYKSDLATRAF